MSESVFETLWGRVVDFLGSKRELYVFDGQAAAGEHATGVRVVSEFAWQMHFCKNMFRPQNDDDDEKKKKTFVMYNAPGLQLTEQEVQRFGLNSEAFVAFHLGRGVGVVGGTSYAGEMKKGIFSVVNYEAPLKGVLPMHCAANVGRLKDVALFYGLSGTGKTTLSADPKRRLIGDDEHLWDDRGISNIEGGCYAKCLGLDPAKEPSIFSAIRENALLENVKVDADSLKVDYSSSEKTQNTRVSYPLAHVDNHTTDGGHPSTIIFLACDAFGVLPPLSALSPEEAAYHFLSGYTSKVAGTERGLTEPTATFSSCYGAAFLPLHPTVYAELLKEKMRRHAVRAFLVNTGWTGGPPGVGHRMPLQFTRAILDALFTPGALDHDDFTRHPLLNLNVPNRLGSDVPAHMLHPWTAWPDSKAYDAAANRLAAMFVDNFTQFHDPHAARHGPQVDDLH
mmetsp:Transcript_19071/g.58756  ORF Transcript_19071/g.58756 Transcript_19071/m.58756 type:complete len:451 (+) Transcript_19071:392-1744(+)